MCDRNGTRLKVGDQVIWVERRMLLYVLPTDRSIVRNGFSIAVEKKLGAGKIGYVSIKDLEKR